MSNNDVKVFCLTQTPLHRHRYPTEPVVPDDPACVIEPEFGINITDVALQANQPSRLAILVRPMRCTISMPCANFSSFFFVWKHAPARSEKPFNQIRHIISFVLCLVDWQTVATRSLFVMIQHLPRTSHPLLNCSVCELTYKTETSNVSHNTPPVGRHSRQRQPLRPQVLTQQRPPPRQPNPSTTNYN